MTVIASDVRSQTTERHAGDSEEASMGLEGRRDHVGGEETRGAHGAPAKKWAAHPESRRDVQTATVTVVPPAPATTPAASAIVYTSARPVQSIIRVATPSPLTLTAGAHHGLQFVQCQLARRARSSPLLLHAHGGGVLAIGGVGAPVPLSARRSVHPFAHGRSAVTRPIQALAESAVMLLRRRRQFLYPEADEVHHVGKKKEVMMKRWVSRCAEDGMVGPGGVLSRRWRLRAEILSHAPE
eukprot:ctg_880.g371